MTEFNAPLSIEEVTPAPIAPRQALVGIAAGGLCHLHRDFPRLIELAATGRLDVATMVARRIGLDEVDDGLAAIGRGEVIRSVIVN